MIGDRFYVTLIAAPDGVHWDLRSGSPDEASVRIAEGTAHSWPASTHQAGRALDQWTRARLTKADLDGPYLREP